MVSTLLPCPDQRLTQRAIKTEDWPAQIKALVGQEEKGALLDSVIDSSGGEILSKVGKILRHGGKVVCYGM